MKDGNGTETVSYQLGPECDDGFDNDLDSDVDTLDSDCASSSDAAERLSGNQSYAPPTVPVDIASDGTLTLDPEAMTWPQIELGGIGIQLSGVGDTVESEDVSIDVPMQLDLVGLDGAFSGMGSCSVGIITPHFVLQSYNQSTGLAVYESSGAPVAAVDDCGSSYNSAINQVLGLPGTIDLTMSGIVANGSGGHPHN